MAIKIDREMILEKGGPKEVRLFQSSAGQGSRRGVKGGGKPPPWLGEVWLGEVKWKIGWIGGRNDSVRWKWGLKGRIYTQTRWVGGF